MINFNYWKILFTDRVSVNKKYLTDSVSVNKKFLTDSGVPIEKKHVVHYWFWKYSPIFLFLIQPYFGHLLHFFGSFGAIFWSFGAVLGVKIRFRPIFGIGVRFKNFLGPTYVDNQLLVFEVQPYLFLLVLVTFGASFVLFGTFMAIFGSFGLFLGSGSDSKTIFGTYLCSQSTLVLEVQSYLFVLIRG